MWGRLLGAARPGPTLLLSMSPRNTRAAKEVSEKRKRKQPVRLGYYEDRAAKPKSSVKKGGYTRGEAQAPEAALAASRARHSDSPAARTCVPDAIADGLALMQGLPHDVASLGRVGLRAMKPAGEDCTIGRAIDFLSPLGVSLREQHSILHEAGGAALLLSRLPKGVFVVLLAIKESHHDPEPDAHAVVYDAGTRIMSDPQTGDTVTFPAGLDPTKGVDRKAAHAALDSIAVGLLVRIRSAYKIVQFVAELDVE